MTSALRSTIEMGEDCDANTKTSAARAAERGAREGVDAPLDSDAPTAVFLLGDGGSEGSDSASSDQETDVKMTKDVLGDKLKASKPIAIPNKLNVPVGHNDTQFRYTNRPDSPINSVGDAAYDSPTLPRPSKDFNHVMIKLRRNGDIQRVRSYDNVGMDDSDSESCNSSLNLPISSSLPANVHKRRTVRFDETTITLTADLGESAARFRSQWRKKRAAANIGSPSTRFGESKNISVCHTEDDKPVDSPLLERANNGKSIFDVCNYSSYGRYT